MSSVPNWGAAGSRKLSPRVSIRKELCTRRPDGVSVGWIGHDLVPATLGDVKGDNRQPSAILLLETLEQIVLGNGVKRLSPPIVEDGQIGATQPALDAWMTVIVVRQGESPKSLGTR